jgi:hypothetical protein
VVEMVEKFPVEKEVLDQVHRSLVKESDELLAILTHLGGLVNSTTDKKIRKFLDDSYKKVFVRFDLLMSVEKSLGVIRYFDINVEAVEVAEVVEVAEAVEVVEVAEVADSYIVYTVESQQTIKSESFNKKSHAIEQAKKWVLENSKQHVYISGYRSKDGQDFYINPNGNAELIGKSWGENSES